MANVTSPPDADTTFERLPKEPMKAWQAFVMYRDMGFDRTMEGVRLSLTKPSGYLRQLQEWSIRFEWVKRARLYDDHIERSARAAAERSIPLWEQRRQESLEANMALAAKLRDRLSEMLDHPITKEVIKEFDGKTVTYIIPANWSFSSIANMVKVVAELEAATIGEAMQGAGHETFDVESATIDELRAFISRNRSRGNAQAGTH